MHDRYTFTDHEGVERVLHAPSLDAAHAAAHRFVLGQSNSLAAAAIAQRSVEKEPEPNDDDRTVSERIRRRRAARAAVTGYDDYERRATEAINSAARLGPEAAEHEAKKWPPLAWVTLTDDDAELTVTLGDLIVFDPTGRDLGSEYVVGVVIEIDAEAQEPGERPAPLVRINGESPGQLCVVRRAKTVLTA